MTDPRKLAEHARRRHTSQIRERPFELVTHVRRVVGKVDDPWPQALFDTSAGTLAGLQKASGDFETGDKPAWPA